MIITPIRRKSVLKAPKYPVKTVLQVFFLQDLQDLALNLATLALKIKLFLQDIKILQDNFLARLMQDLQDMCKI